METVSGKYVISLNIVLLASLLCAGCNTLLPARDQAGVPAVVQDGVQGDADSGAGIPAERSTVTDGGTDVASFVQQPLTLSSRGVPLPKQAYNEKGEKIPYVPQPNPYTRDTKPVPAEAKVMFMTASARIKQGDLAAARANLEMITERYPDLSGPWKMLGDLSQQDGEYDRAIGHYRKAIGLNRNNVNAYVALGITHRKRGDFNGAQDAYTEALRVWKDFPEAHLNLAILYDLYANEASAAQQHYEAYHFLTGGKNMAAGKWLAEVKLRTGNEQSFIDNPPVRVTLEPPPKADESSVATGPENPG
jgi:hypothetical protein